MKNRIIICGPSGSGKDYLKNLLCDNLGYIDTVLHTTRPKRVGETDGKDYHFITSNEFLNLSIKEKIIATSAFNKWLYGISVYEWEKSNVTVLSPESLREVLVELPTDTHIIYLNPPESIRIDRINNRLGNADSVTRRVEADRKDFKDFKDFTIEINDPQFTIEMIAKYIK